MKPATMVLLLISVIAAYAVTVAGRRGPRRSHTDAETVRATILPQFGSPESDRLLSPGKRVRN